MSVNIPQVKKRSDYKAPNFLIETVDLTFHLESHETRVICTTKVKRQGSDDSPLHLDGVELTLVRVNVNGAPHLDYSVEDKSLVIKNLPDLFELTIETMIDPANNSSLEGLYQSAGSYCTQCEAEGFRKITYFLDRPDVLAEYKVCIVADKTAFPYLLSNGNKIDSGETDDGKHWVTWHDPFKKPCYLFALVAGDFDLLEDTFVTQSNRTIPLQLFVDKGKRNRGQHALDSLKKAMTWDENTFGLEYDLDIYMIVAVDFFNMGAMENKGLNVFNSKFVLADSDSATDEDYFNIESVIAHEYFHNWTGNRITCRDWFQLSLKEGLTVFRDQQFSADMSSAVVNRIKNVKIIREHQFAEDAGPMSHPIRPDEVIEMNNFYTVTVYDKGAEVIRMMHTLLGSAGFRSGMDLYFQRFDGQAVTCDDFVQAMQDANNFDLSQFKNWYSQSGTPLVRVTDTYDADKQLYTITFEQINSATADQSDKQNLYIPVVLDLHDSKGNVLPIGEGKDDSHIIHLLESKQSIEVEAKSGQPIPSLLGNFSAPVRLEYPYTDQQLKFIAIHGRDGFCRWDASQALYSKIIHDVAQNSQVNNQKNNDLHEMISECISSITDNPALSAEMLIVPSFETLCQQVKKYDVEALFNAREFIQKEIASVHEIQWLTLYNDINIPEYRYEKSQLEHRRVKNISLKYLSLANGAADLLTNQYKQSDNMTDTLSALKAAQVGNLDIFDKLMPNFESRWSHDPLVLDKWFSMHASTNRKDILPRLDLLAGHSQYKINNPNRVRALVGTFAFFNPMGFHADDGSGYRFLTDYLLKLDEINPQVSARIVTPLTQWRGLDEHRQSLVKTQLVRLIDKKDLSKDVFEKVSKSLKFIPD